MLIDDNKRELCFVSSANLLLLSKAFSFLKYPDVAKHCLSTTTTIPANEEANQPSYIGAIHKAGDDELLVHIEAEMGAGCYD